MILFEIVRALAGLAAGGVIGFGFGMAQDLARQRNARRQTAGAFGSGWAAMPGSFSRVGYLLLALVAVQLLCPLLFAGTTQWWVSGGVVSGYGAILLRQLLRSRSREA